ncbi:hemerythrin domain-containing protein [Longispora albida]|uniref:hemerythrin domain-containing protein n=1 Tax=Longispora albida TaxID=203523 RepID=UPI000477EA57|nr:hemerythrin domain-containing protein [Longispora albida]
MLDVTLMGAMHDALRREASRLSRLTARADVDLRAALRTAPGWELFKAGLRVHHSAEDDALWPVLRRNLAGRPSDLTLLEAMEAEHGAIDQVVQAVDAALADPGIGLDRLGDLADSLVTGLLGHLGHEERQALPLIRAVITQEQWVYFGQVHIQRISRDASRLLPWLLDGAGEQTASTVLAAFPGPARCTYTRQWRPAYLALDLWNSTTA